MIALVVLLSICGCVSVNPDRRVAPTDAEMADFLARSMESFSAERFDEALRDAEAAWTRGWRLSDVAYSAACAAARSGKTGDAFLWLQRSVGTGKLDSNWMNADPDLTSVRADPRYPPLLAEARRIQQRRIETMQVGTGLQSSTPAAEGIDAEALRRLVERAEKTHSSALVVLRNGKMVGNWSFGSISAPTETMSATKAVTSLAIGLLIDDKKIPSVDEPVSTWFPEWKDGAHDGITLRHVLNHTSGLHADRTTEKIYASKDFVRFALESNVDAPPGTEFFYNNSAVNVLVGVVHRASGMPMDGYLRARVFEPLGIRDFSWSHDRSGNPHGFAGLQIHAADFAKIGQLLLQKGRWNGKQVISEAWIAESTQRSGQPFNPVSGLLWWLESPQTTMVIDQNLMDALLARGADAEFVANLAPLRDQPIPRLEFGNELRRVLGPKGIGVWFREVERRRLDARTVVNGDFDGFSARGAFGQILLVYPSRRLVAVRFTTRFDQSDPEINFRDFASLVRALVEPAPP